MSHLPAASICRFGYIEITLSHPDGGALSTVPQQQQQQQQQQQRWSPQPSDLRAYFLHTDVKRTGEFRSNASMLNAIHATVIQTVLSNLQSLPSDVSL